jgi:hypothetical protein
MGFSSSNPDEIRDDRTSLNTDIDWSDKGEI